jgi:hypothetical protein
MSKLIPAFFLSLILISCAEKENHSKHHAEAKKETLDFSSLIPGDLPDSVKVIRLTETVKKNEWDTTFTIRKFSDKSITISAYFRNDSLQKIVARPAFKDIEVSSHMSYYFLIDTFICLHYECSRTGHTGRCNPVSASSKFYFYKDHILSQEHDVHIGDPYGTCGCSDLSAYGYQSKTDFEKNIIKEVRQLKSMIRNH